MSEPNQDNLLALDRVGVADLVVDVWRIQKRAERDAATPGGVVIACERAMERLSDLGFRLDELVGQPYDDGMRVRVVHWDGGTRNARVSECLSPAVYHNDEHLKRAAVVVKGEEA